MVLLDHTEAAFLAPLGRICLPLRRKYRLLRFGLIDVVPDTEEGETGHLLITSVELFALLRLQDDLAIVELVVRR